MNTSSRLTLLCAALVVALMPPIAAQQPAPKYRWVDHGEQHFAELQADDAVLVRYMYAPIDESTDERRAETYKPYLHVYSPDGSTLLTKGPGGLFPHHRGIFFGFNKITYGDGKRCDTWHCTQQTHEQHERFASIDADANGGQLESIVHWYGAAGEHFATENRQQTVRLVDGMTQIDFASHLATANDMGPIHLDGDPQHAGVQFRATQQVPDKTADQTYYLRTDGKGKPGETRNWDHNKTDAPGNAECTNRPWLAMSIVVDGERYTVLYLDHPDNPKPSHYSERDYGRFGSFFVTDVTDDKPLDVKYRYFIKQGEMTVGECQQLCDDFVASSSID